MTPNSFPKRTLFLPCTDDRRLLVFTRSGKRALKEAYAYLVETEGGAPQRRDVTLV